MTIIEHRTQYLSGIISKDDLLVFMEDYLNGMDFIYELSYTEQATIEEIETDYYNLLNYGNMG